jgi:hypothetical protein
LELNGEFAVNQPHPLLHADQAKSSLSLDLVQVEVVTGVFNAKCHTVSSAQERNPDSNIQR